MGEESGAIGMMPSEGPEQAPEGHVERVGLDSFVPGHWFTDRAKSSFWLSAFRVARVVPRDELSSGPRVLDLGPVRAVVFYGQFDYLHPGLVALELPETADPTPLHFKCEGMGVRETPRGVWLLLLTPYDVDGTSGDEAATRRRIESAAGLLAVFGGFNLVFEPGPENIFSLGTGQPTVASPALVQPFAFPKPNVSEEYFAEVRRVSEQIRALPRVEGNRVELALHWFHLALRDRGTDAFLKRWIALEVLAMPDGTNIKPINDALAAAYGLTHDQARSTFRVGLLADLRSRIVHEGEPIPIHHWLELYVDAMFFDVLLSVLGAGSERRAAGLLGHFGADFWSIAIPPRPA